MRRQRSVAVPLAVLGLGLACAANPSAKDATMQDADAESTPSAAVPAKLALAPQWREGDGWDVRYRVLVPNPAKSADAPPLYEEHDWRYAVEKVEADGLVRISATSLEEDAETWRIALDEDGVLRELRAPRGDAPGLGVGPLVPLEPGAAWNLSPAWPVLPTEPGERSFGDGAVTQHVAVEGSTWTVTLTRRGQASGTETERTVMQRWDAARPWWSTMTIERRTTWKDETFEVVELEGRVMAWGTTAAAGGTP
ncbi:MAG: hypothetical protein AB1Z98_30795 [Nannocystaceae bacterium]